jgi:molybdenum cofactor cytidylyltransferase
VILAAGASRRLGQPKLLLPYQGTPLLRRAVTAAEGGGCVAVLVVLGADRERYRPLLRDTAARVVVNPDHAEGMSTSIRAGILALPAACDAALILLADQPRIDAAIVRRLIAAYERTGRPIIAARYGSVLGAPALFDRSLFLELLLLEGDQGARQVIETHAADVAEVTIPAEAALDVDRPEDLRGLQGV